MGPASRSFSSKVAARDVGKIQRGLAGGLVRGLAGGWLGVGRAQLPPLPLLILFLPILPPLSLFLLPFLLPARPHTSWGSKEDRGRSRSRISRRRDMKRRRSNHGQNERISRRGEEADPCSRRSRDYARPLVRWCYSPLVSWVSGFLPSRVPPAKLTHFTPHFPSPSHLQSRASIYLAC